MIHNKYIYIHNHVHELDQSTGKAFDLILKTKSLELKSRLSCEKALASIVDTECPRSGIGFQPNTLPFHISMAELGLT